MKKIALVILNFNGRHLLEKFLPSVLAHSLPGTEIIVADNGSSDDSPALIQQRFPQVRLIAMPENTGFATGYNIALRQVEAQYYILLNSDVEVTPGWMEPLVELMDSHADIAACQPKIKSRDNKNLFEHAGAGGGFLDKFGYPFCRGRLFDSLETDTGQYDDTRQVFWASGACMFVRADLYHRFGGLDDDFFAHMEEIDLCWRLQNAGYKVYYCGKSTVYHIGGGTLPVSSPRKTFLNFRNGLVMLFKNLPQNQLFSIIFMRMVLDGVAGLRFLWSGQLGNLMAVLKAHFYLYAHWGMIFRKRKEIQKTVSTTAYGIFNNSIVWQYFVRGRKKFTELQN